MKHLFVMWMLCISILCAGCSRGGNSEHVESDELLPEVLRGESFIYDELEHNTGNLLYTLKFTETGYKLYNDNDVGVISLGYEERQDVLVIESIEPKATVVPYVEGQMIRMPAGTAQITFTFDEAIKSVSDDTLANIKVLSGHSVVGDYEVLLDGNVLKIVFDQSLEPDTDYTVIIPQGILISAEDENIINNYNSIFGFVTGE